MSAFHVAGLLAYRGSDDRFAAVADDRSAERAVSNVPKAEIDPVVAEGCLESLAFWRASGRC